MPTYKQCPKHGLYLAERDTCPSCRINPYKKSKKYGGKTIIIPPNMRSVK